MVIYSHHYSSAYKEVRIKPIEIEKETPKLYITKNRQRIPKDKLYKLKDQVFSEMYCLEPNPESYLNALIERKESVIESAEKRLEGLREEECELRSKLFDIQHGNK